MKAILVVKLAEGYLILPTSNPFIGSDTIERGRVVEKSYSMSSLRTAIEGAFRDVEERIIPTPPPAPEATDDIPV